MPVKAFVVAANAPPGFRGTRTFTSPFSRRQDGPSAAKTPVASSAGSAKALNSIVGPPMVRLRFIDEPPAREEEGRAQAT